ncbi:hypothetical protein [uncultured Sphingomonas sp.]|uniref:hypothetical protein n=1 Tax=uncultured Sphingomonas sp. TaxID=158754 RepID=UPI0026384119|nr:hypothetical protein [uncultured Sphingomonas sp.]
MTGGKVRPGEDGILPNHAARDLEQGTQPGSAIPEPHEKPAKPPLGAKVETTTENLSETALKPS